MKTRSAPSPRRRGLLILAVLGAAGLIAAVGGPLVSAGNLGTREADVDSASYAEDQGISLSEAQRRLTVMENAGRAQETFAKVIGERFGGLPRRVAPP